MPRIPVYTRTQSLPAKSPGALVSPAAAAAPALQIAGLGADMQRLSMFVAAKYKQAEEFNELSTKTISAAKELNDLEFNLRQQENFDSVLEDFDRNATDVRSRYNEEIEDAQVKKRFAINFDRMALAKRTGLQIYRRNRQTDAYKANLIRNMEDYRDLMVTLSGPAREIEYADYMNRVETDVETAARAGILTQVEAINALKTFGDQVNVARVERDILANPGQAYKDIVTGKYKKLDPESVTELTKKARSEWQYRILVAEKMDTQAEKLIKEERERATLDFLVQHSQGKLTIDMLNDAATTRTINSTQYKSLYNMLTKDRPEKSVESVMLYHIRDIDQGKGDRQQILDDAAMGLLTPTDSIKLLNRHQAWQDREKKNENAHYKWANDYLEGRILTTGPLAAMRKTDEETALMGAKRELDARIEKEQLQAWQVRDAAIEIGEAWALKPLGGVSVRKVRGSRPKSGEEIDQLREKTIQDLYDGKMTADDAERDARALEEYELILRRQAEAREKAQTAQTTRRR